MQPEQMLLRHICKGVGLPWIGLLWGRDERIMSVVLHGNVVDLLDDICLKAFVFVSSKMHIVRTSCGVVVVLIINWACF